MNPARPGDDRLPLLRSEDPLANPAHGHLHQLAGGGVTPSARPQRKRSVSQLNRRYSWDAKVDCMSFHMLAMFGHTGLWRVLPERRVCFGRPVPADDIDHAIQL